MSPLTVEVIADQSYQNLTRRAREVVLERLHRDRRKRSEVSDDYFRDQVAVVRRELGNGQYVN